MLTDVEAILLCIGAAILGWTLAEIKNKKKYNMKKFYILSILWLMALMLFFAPFLFTIAK